MKYSLLIILTLFGVVISTFALTQSELEEQKSGLELWKAEALAKPKSDSDYAYLNHLATGLRKMPRQRIYSISEKYEVYQRLQESIIQFPHYAEIFRDQLIKIYDDRLAMPDNSFEYQRATANYSDASSGFFLTMESLPTKETVLALADLYDYSKFDPRPADDAHLPAESIPMLAGKTLNQLPINNRPAPRLDLILSHGQEIKDMVEKWRLWCKDVKAGKIEPEFGPEVFENGDSIPPIAMRHQIRAPKPAPVKNYLSDSATSSSESSWPWITAASAATVLAGYAAWKVKKNKV